LRIATKVMIWFSYKQ